MTALLYHPLPTSAWADADNTYLKKAKFLKNHSLPGVDEIRLNIGSQLGEIFFTQTSVTMRQLLAIDKELEGPTEQLWTSPKDQLKGKMVLTEPYPRRLVQAMTHQDILDIGQNLEKKIEQSIIGEQDKALLEREEKVRNEMTKVMNERIEEVRKEMENLYRNRLQDAKYKLISQFKEAMEERDKIICKKADEKVLESLSYLRKSMEEEMELMAKRMEDYTADLNKFQLTWSANQANEVFKKKVNNLNKKWKNILQKATEKSEKEKQDLKLQLMELHHNELKNVQEACYESYQKNLSSGTYNYRKTISDLLKAIRTKDGAYEKLKIEKECAHVEQYSWCYLVRELLKQFQNFINYALKTKPGHAEYFLSLEKILQNRILLLSQAEFLRKYVDEKGKHLLDKHLDREDAKLKLLPLEQIKQQEKTKPEYPCLPEDILRPTVEKKKKITSKEATKDIEDIIDKVIKIAMPKRITDLPCIDSELWASAKSEPDNLAWPAEPKTPGLRIVGEQNKDPIEQPLMNFTKDRIQSVIKALNMNPRIKLAIIGNNNFVE